MNRYQRAAFITVLLIMYFCSRDVSAQIMVAPALPDLFLVNDRDGLLWRVDPVDGPAEPLGVMQDETTGETVIMADIA